uniref:Putative secreted peptide n=1 Tax=Anopheles braziliensis TaxID=58242 RepID=A0A2M3ZV50_9DIPT
MVLLMPPMPPIGPVLLLLLLVAPAPPLPPPLVADVVFIVVVAVTGPAVPFAATTLLLAPFSSFSVIFAYRNGYYVRSVRWVALIDAPHNNTLS